MARPDAGFRAALPERGRHREVDRLDVTAQIERAALASHRRPGLAFADSAIPRAHEDRRLPQGRGSGCRAHRKSRQTVLRLLHRCGSARDRALRVRAVHRDRAGDRHPRPLAGGDRVVSMAGRLRQAAAGRHQLGRQHLAAASGCAHAEVRERRDGPRDGVVPVEVHPHRRRRGGQGPVASLARSARAHARARLEGHGSVQGWFTTQVAEYLAKHGRVAVGWDEILHGKVPASAVIMSWHEPAGALDALKQGHDVVMASSPTLYLDHYQSNLHDEPPGRPEVESLQDVYDYNPLPAGATAAEAKHILGVQANLWAEYMPTFARVQHAVFPRIAALAEVAWSPASTHDWRSFLDRMPAELARYQALGIAYADSAFAPAFALSAGAHAPVDAALSNQADFGTIRYTTDGTAPNAASTIYSKPLSFPAHSTTTLRAATFAAGGFELAAPRTQVVDATALLNRNSDQLDTCKNQLVLRLEDDRPLEGQRPVYRIDIENMCWLWKGAPLDGVKRIALTVGNLPWNFALWTDDSSVVTRPKQTPTDELQVHRDSCDGPLLATLPLAKAVQTKLQTTLTANIPATTGNHTLCVFATGDPRDGLWAVGKVELKK